MSDNDELITLKDVTKRLKCSKMTIQRRVNGFYDRARKKHYPPLAGFPKPHKIGQRWFFKAGDIEKFIESTKVA